MEVFHIFKCVFLKTTFTTNYCHIEGSNSRNFVSMAINSILMTDNLKCAGIFRKSVYFFLGCPFLTFTFRILGVFVGKL